MDRFLLTRPILLACLGLIALCGDAIAQRTNSANSAATMTLEPRRFERRLHDPSTIAKCKDEYWLFSTGMGISSRHSKDLVNWSRGPCVFTNPPSWTANAVPGNRGYFWAPDLIGLTKRYFLYYSVSTWGKNTSAIGLAAC